MRRAGALEWSLSALIMWLLDPVFA